ncbi:MAG: RDD family protein [Bacteroidia bacterium]|nr:RDD family protein [Bacteroidia bacterium]
MQTIEINTAQNVPIVYELGGLRDRLLAYLIDMITLMGTLWLLTILFTLAIPTLGQTGSEVGLYSLIILLILIFFFYTPAMELFNNGQSLGKMAFKIKVVRLDGGELTSTDILTRWMFRMLDIYFCAGSVAAMLVSSTEKGQRLGDLMGNTTVIRLQPRMSMALSDVLKIQSIADYTPLYPDARNIHEDDMLVIKNVLERQQKFPNPAHGQAVSLAATRIAGLLKLDAVPKNKIVFLKTVLKDYVVMTR